MATVEAKNFSRDADEVATPNNARVETVNVLGQRVMRLTVQPGWKWSECVKPAVGGHSCQAGHVGVVVQGSMKCVHDDGTEIIVKAGDAYYFAPGHDGWVLGDEVFIGYEFVESGKDFGPWKSSAS